MPTAFLYHYHADVEPLPLTTVVGGPPFILRSLAAASRRIRIARARGPTGLDCPERGESRRIPGACEVLDFVKVRGLRP